MATTSSTRRMIPVLALVVVLVVVFLVRLIDIQVVKADEYTSEAEARRSEQTTVYSTRGDIIDANGAVLADSVERYDLTVSPRVALGFTDLNGSVTEPLEKIAAITGQDSAALMGVLTADPDSDYAVLAQGLSLDQFDAISALSVPWVYMVRVPSRIYPNGQVAGNLIGKLGTDAPLAGIEMMADEWCLAGSDGTVSYERGEDGVRLPGTGVETTPMVDGGTVQLTIDRDLQWYVQERMAQTAAQLGATWATAVVMRVEDAALMAVTDWPTVDPNDIDATPDAFLGSRAFAISYEPGSTMKAINAAMAIEEGVATPWTQITAPQQMDFGAAGVIVDQYPRDPQMTLTGSLVYSSNPATVQIAQLLAPSTRLDYYEKFGFNQPTAVGFDGEDGGLIHPTDQWDARTTLTVAFGQGMMATSVQVASAYQTIANGGVREPVHLIDNCTTAAGEIIEPDLPQPVTAVSESTAAQVTDMLETVAVEGSASEQLAIPGYNVAAKSGASEVAEGGVYTNSTIVSYAGFAPADDPEYVVVVTAGVPSITLSSSIAGAFHDVLSQVLTTNRVLPSTEPASVLPTNW